MRQAKKLLNADYWPPAKRGDVLRAMRHHPKAIVLIDGVFEAVPSVWHHELRLAMGAGIAVFGASSMGALRAAELHEDGMVGVGVIAERYRRGQWRDDDDVALLHGPEELGFKALTVPHVCVWGLAQEAKAVGALSPREAAALLRASKGIFYQRRTWSRLEKALNWPAERLERLRALRNNATDLKAQDAQACLKVTREFLRGDGSARPKTVVMSSGARATLLQDAYDCRPMSETQRGRALTRWLVADAAQRRGLRVDVDEVRRLARALENRGVDRAHAVRWAGVLALETAAVNAAAQLTGGNVSEVEAIALERVLALAREAQPNGAPSPFAFDGVRATGDAVRSR